MKQFADFVRFRILWRQVWANSWLTNFQTKFRTLKSSGRVESHCFKRRFVSFLVSNSWILQMIGIVFPFGRSDGRQKENDLFVGAVKVVYKYHFNEWFKSFHCCFPMTESEFVSVVYALLQNKRRRWCAPVPPEIIFEGRNWQKQTIHHWKGNLSIHFRHR